MTFFPIDPVAFWIGPVAVRWYALAYLAGFILGWRYCLYLAGLDETKKPDKNDIEDVFPWIILGVILGGRIGYVLFYNLPYYLENPGDILKIWEGGMAFHGGLLGVVCALIIFPMLRNFNPFRLADMVCASVPIGIFFGRVANFINAELYGRVTEVPWGVVFPGGGAEPRHPSQLYEAILEGAVLFIVLWGMIRMPSIREKPGLVSGAFLLGYGLFRTFVEFFREPDAHIGYLFDVISMGQILSLPMIIAGLGLMIAAKAGWTKLKTDQAGHGKPA